LFLESTNKPALSGASAADFNNPTKKNMLLSCDSRIFRVDIKLDNIKKRVLYLYVFTDSVDVLSKNLIYAF
jgi:hypothetical protein